MSSPEQPFASRFMDDYFAEADEHLVAIRRGLLSLESSIGAELSAAGLEDLFRSFHSLKGISAMVEFREAEMLSHHIESMLRAIRDREIVLDAARFDALVDGAHLLEEVIFARRENRPQPPIQSFVARLEGLAHAHAAPPASSVGTDATPAPPAAGSVWKVTFAPTPELVARGIKVDTVRARLMQIGRILAVAPKVVAGGGVSFEFELQTDDEQALAAWGADGLTYERLADYREPAGDTPAAADAPRPGRGDDAAQVLSTNFVRVDLARLDELMRLTGDMVVTRARLEDTLGRIERHVPFQEWRALQEHTAGLERQLRDLREGVMRVRLVPVGEIFRRMPFVVRDLARDSGKRVRLELVGQGTEIDKFLIERMLDPVVHLVRNAISHGIETPDARAAAGKPAEGTITLAASTAGESVVIEVADDGAGIDLDEVSARARTLGIIAADGPLNQEALLDVLCASGFSTRTEADRGAGRGVGMGVVRAAVQALGGSLAVDATPGHGTRFRITLPLTLAITDAIIAQVGDQTFAVPQSAVTEVIEIDPSALSVIERNELTTYRGHTLPMVRLSKVFRIDAPPRPRLHAIVVGAGLAALGLVVDRIAGQREIVVKTIVDPLIRVDGVSGATELGDGRLVLILDAAALSRAWRDRPAAGIGASA